jgi:hypothetical protein
MIPSAQALVGGLGLICFALMGLLTLARLCDGKRAAKAQAAEMPSDYVITTIPDEIVHTEAGAFRVSDGEWVPFNDREAA